ncbi:helix-turn-helix domain-containing protein [Clostridioides difficile]
MTLGEKIVKLRKEYNYSQELLAERLDVSRQTISKWELDQAKPDLENIKNISNLFNTTYDYLIDENNLCSKDITDNTSKDIDWTKAWSGKYPILESYVDMNGIEKYQIDMEELYLKFEKEYGMSNENTILVLKDILYKIFKKHENKKL